MPRQAEQNPAPEKPTAQTAPQEHRMDTWPQSRGWQVVPEETSRDPPASPEETQRVEDVPR